jgi:hypothetical protein
VTLQPGSKGQDAHHDVGIGTLSVGVRMMAVVLAYPSFVAQADAEVALKHAQDLTGPPGPGDLPVPGVIVREPDLSEHDRQKHSHSYLPPRVTYQDEGGPMGTTGNPG